MSGVDIKAVFPNLVGKYASARQEMFLFTAAQMQTNRGLLFDAEGARNGNKRWSKPRFRSGMTMSARGTLRKSLGVDGRAGPGGIVRFSGTRVQIGSALIYAAMMNWGTTKLPGGVLRAKDGKVLRIPLPAGKRATPEAKTLRKTEAVKRVADYSGKTEHVIFRKWVKIPERRYDLLTTRDMLEIGKALSNKLAEVLNR